MTIRTYLWGMRLLVLIALVALVLVVYLVSPNQGGILAQVLFYVSLFFFLTGTTTLFLFWARRMFSKENSGAIHVGISFREGALVALAVCVLLVLQSFRWLVWWDGGIVVAGVFLAELWFLSR
ncbi:MAG: hypothetical protein PHF35_04640 [Candidatus Moranbacteria bacterium]|nr:hypothetical protein [Candidatus Moranbacteria bacterium]